MTAFRLETTRAHRSHRWLLTITAILASGLGFVLPVGQPANALNPSGDLSIEVIAAPNLVVDSNVESPSSYAPEAAHLGATICNTGDDALSNVLVSIGDRDPNGDADPIDSAPGTYPSRTHQRPVRIVLADPRRRHPDATRYIRSLAAGECTTQYWLVAYPTLDANGNAVTGGSSIADDLWLNYDIWAQRPRSGRLVPLPADVTETVTCATRSRRWPTRSGRTTPRKFPRNTSRRSSKQLGWRPDQESTCRRQRQPQGIWYDLGNIGQGFDADGDFQPDYDLWMQPVGDPDCSTLPAPGSSMSTACW